MVNAVALKTRVAGTETTLHSTLSLAGVVFDFVAEAGNYIGVPVLAFPCHELLDEVGIYGVSV